MTPTGKRILIVADNPYNDQWYAERLEHEGYNVVLAGFQSSDCAVDAATALLRQGAQFDLIMTGMVLSTSGEIPEFIGGERQGWDVGLRFLDLARKEGYQGSSLVLETSPGLHCVSHKILNGHLVLADGRQAKVVTKEDLISRRDLQLAEIVADILAEAPPAPVPAAAEPAGP